MAFYYQLLLFSEFSVETIALVLGLVSETVVFLAQHFDLGGEHCLVLSWPVLADAEDTGFLSWVHLAEEGRRSLPELADLHFYGQPLLRRHDPIHFHVFLVGHVIEQVIRHDSVGASLLEAEYEINPLVDVR